MLGMQETEVVTHAARNDVDKEDASLMLAVSHVAVGLAYPPKKPKESEISRACFIIFDVVLRAGYCVQRLSTNHGSCSSARS
eukprot:4473344-Amphidinium_carterae.1